MQDKKSLKWTRSAWDGGFSCHLLSPLNQNMFHEEVCFPNVQWSKIPVVTWPLFVLAGSEVSLGKGRRNCSWPGCIPAQPHSFTELWSLIIDHYPVKYSYCPHFTNEKTAVWVWPLGQDNSYWWRLCGLKPSCLLIFMVYVLFFLGVSQWPT